jgi:3-hydroxyanthranilate 3,4-dioxygenase
MLSLPIDFNSWISENQHLLQPPVNNYCIYDTQDYTVMAIGGPNQRRDYHINVTEVLFCFIIILLGILLSNQG